LENTLTHVGHETEILYYFLFPDGQTKVVNRSLGNLLRTLVGEHKRSCDLKLPTAEFVYNTVVNRTSGKSSRELFMV